MLFAIIKSIYVRNDGDCGDKSPCYSSIQGTINVAATGSHIGNPMELQRILYAERSQAADDSRRLGFLLLSPNIRPFKLDQVKEVLTAIGVKGITVSEVK